MRQDNAADMLQHAIYKALVTADAALAEIGKCREARAFSVSQARWTRDLSREIASRTIFVKSKITDFRHFAEDLARQVDAETQSGFVADDNAVSGGYIETHVSEKGQHLAALQSTLRQLIRQLEAVEFQRAAEQIAQELRS